MIKKYLFVILLLGLFNIALAQPNSNIIRFSGYVYDNETKEPIPFAHIRNYTIGVGTISDTLGLFNLYALLTDTIHVSSVGYENSSCPISDLSLKNTYFISIPLKKTVYKLKEVDVFALSNRTQFRHDFLNMECELPEKKIIIPGVTKYLEREESIYPVNFSRLNPISYFYYKNSKEGKSLRKLAMLVAQDKISEKVALKYNKDILQELTGFKSDTLQAFFDYINLTNQYVLKTEQYDICKRILDSLPPFKAKENMLSDTTLLDK